MRLIDADRLMDNLKGNVLIDVTPELERAIEQQPTAFDKENVIKIISHVNSAIAVGDKNALYWMAKLEEIVEKGGIE